eukprot:scaffold217997_cov31-Tisochrysis_lutea.AAC.2
MFSARPETLAGRGVEKLFEGRKEVAEKTVENTPAAMHRERHNRDSITCREYLAAIRSCKEGTRPVLRDVGSDHERGRNTNAAPWRCGDSRVSVGNMPEPYKLLVEGRKGRFGHPRGARQRSRSGQRVTPRLSSGSNFTHQLRGGTLR